MFISLKRHNRRVTELLQYNNEQLERRREAERLLAEYKLAANSTFGKLTGPVECANFTGPKADKYHKALPERLKAFDEIVDASGEHGEGYVQLRRFDSNNHCLDIIVAPIRFIAEELLHRYDGSNTKLGVRKVRK